MSSSRAVFLFTALIFISKARAVSYNLPDLCVDAIWMENATTFASQSVISSIHHGMFIDHKDQIYLASSNSSRILVWSEGLTSPVRTILTKLSEYTPLFVTLNGNIYFEPGDEGGRIHAWLNQSNSIVFIAKFLMNCYGLFIDTNESLYCSMKFSHRVSKIALNIIGDIPTTVAGRGSQGSAADEFILPWGIFVDRKFGLYVADAGNGRIQLFDQGKRSAITVAGNGIPNGLQLNLPTNVVVDMNDYLYIADNEQHRIIRVKGDEYRCIAGCTGQSGSAANQLYKAYGAHLHSQGHLYVADEYNFRIQKFELLNDGCNCFPPLIQLVPSALSLKFRRTQDILITSTIKLNCSRSSLISTRWKIFRCSTDCLDEPSLDQLIKTGSNDLFIPAQTLSHGSYKLTLTVTMTAYPKLQSSSTVLLEVVSTPTLVKLVSSDRFSIKHEHGKDLLLDPGRYSFNLHTMTFDCFDWLYQYSCRVTHLNHPSQALKLFDDVQQGCFSNPITVPWTYQDAIQSSVAIFAGSLPPNQTYQFMVEIFHRENSSVHFVGYLDVEIQPSLSASLEISCVTSAMCFSSAHFYYINPTTQLVLSSRCIHGCPSILGVQWKIYQRSENVSDPWIELNSFKSTWFYGLFEKNLTVTRGFFQDHRLIKHWRFQAIYSLPTETLSDNFDVKVNDPPTDGSCSIDPKSGTLFTVFTIECVHWFDDDEIEEYSFYARRNSSSRLMLLSSTSDSTVQLRLPASLDSLSTLSLTVYIHDTLHTEREFSLPPIQIKADVSVFDDLKNSSSLVNQLLHHDDLTIAGQVLYSLVQILDEIGEENLLEATRNGFAATCLSVTPLNRQYPTTVNKITNQSILNEFVRRSNLYANQSESLMVLINDWPTETSYHMKYQALLLATFTQTTNQLTRKTSMLASHRCLQLSNHLSSMVLLLSLEDVQSIADHLLQCMSNVLTAIDGPLQERFEPFEADLTEVRRILNGCRRDSNCSWAEQNSTLAVQNWNYQKATAKRIGEEHRQVIRSVTSILMPHLNINQSVVFNSSAVYFSLEKLSPSSVIFRRDRFQTNISSILSDQNHVFLREMIEPLAISDHHESFSSTNLSRAHSLTLFDEDQTHLETKDEFVEYFIDHDPSHPMAPMALQNVTSLKRNPRLFFHFHLLNLSSLSQHLTYSIQLEMIPINADLSYLLIYQFDQMPVSTHSIEHVDGWKLFCSKDGRFSHLIRQFPRSEHHSIVYGIRQLTMWETMDFCLDRKEIGSLNDHVLFTDDYYLRFTRSGCFYLDDDQQWQSEGLIVGPSTDQHRTQCFRYKNATQQE